MKNQNLRKYAFALSITAGIFNSLVASSALPNRQIIAGMSIGQRQPYVDDLHRRLQDETTAHDALKLSHGTATGALSANAHLLTGIASTETDYIIHAVHDANYKVYVAFVVGEIRNNIHAHFSAVFGSANPDFIDGAVVASSAGKLADAKAAAFQAYIDGVIDAALDDTSPTALATDLKTNLPADKMIYSLANYKVHTLQALSDAISQGIQALGTGLGADMVAAGYTGRPFSTSGKTVQNIRDQIIHVAGLPAPKK